jgi:hypothetical protein
MVVKPEPEPIPGPEIKKPNWYGPLLKILNFILKMIGGK